MPSITPKSPPKITARTMSNEDLGLKVVYEPHLAAAIDVDIIAIHGIGAHPSWTWTSQAKSKGATESSTPGPVNWLSDANMLPAAIPSARIMTFGYDSFWYGDHPVNQRLQDIATSLLNRLVPARKAYLLAQSYNTEYPFIVESIAAMIFMGTPHGGTGGALHSQGKVYAAISAAHRTENAILQTLEPGNDMRTDVVDRFMKHVKLTPHRLKVFCFFEQRATDVGIIIRDPSIREYVVDQTSGTLLGHDSEGLPLNHFDLNKFSGPNDGNYMTVKDRVLKMVDWATTARASSTGPISTAPNDSDAPFAVGFSLSGTTEIPHFVAREKELADIHEKFAQAAGRRSITVQALGGMGKTQLAVAYAKKHQAGYSAVFWLNARDEMTLKEGFSRVAKQILRQHSSVDYISDAVKSTKTTKNDKCAEAVKQWLDQPGNSHWLVIYDNYDNPAPDAKSKGRPVIQPRTAENEADDDLAGVAQPYDIRRFLPTIDHGCILVTTRSPDVEIGFKIKLETMGVEEDSLQILANASGRRGLDKDTGAIALAKELGGLPLALSTAGAYLKGIAISCAEYLELYKISWRSLQEMTPGRKDRALHSTWNISFQQICSKNRESAMLLRLWAYFDNEDLWFQLLRSGHRIGPSWFQIITKDVLQFHQAIRVLCEYGLVEPNTSSSEGRTRLRGYSMHACVHMWAAHVLNARQDIDMARLAIQCVAATKPDYLELEERLIRHADHFLAIERTNRISMLKWGDEWILHNLGDLYTENSQFDNALAMYVRALEGKTKRLGPEDPSTLDTVNSLSILYEYHLDSKLAEPMLDRALEGRMKVLGPEHPSTLDTVRHLGSVYHEQSRHEKARTMYIRALEGYDNVLRPQHPSTLATLIILGDHYETVGWSEEAEDMYKEALDGYEKTLGPEATSTLETTYKLGILYRDCNRFEEATVKLEQARRGYEKTLGWDDSTTLRVTRKLAKIYKRNDQVREATAMYKLVLRGYKDRLEEQHPFILNVRKCLSDLRGEIDRQDDCVSLCINYEAQCQVDDDRATGKLVIPGGEDEVGPEDTAMLGTIDNPKTRRRLEDDGDNMSERGVKRTRMV